ncbi:MAG: CmcJ/NvfI family oxidoreductase [Methyloligellaceae bacterium]
MEEKPQVFMAVNHAEANRRTGRFETVELEITDARLLEDPPQLDREGFTLVNAPSAVSDFYDPEQIERLYYPECAALLKAQTGAREVHIFDHTLRVQDDSKRHAQGTRLPVAIVHNDYTETSAPQRVRDLLEPAKAERFLSGRFAMVNVWRSFGESAQLCPLAAADGRTMAREDYIAVDIVYPDRTGEIYQNAYSPGQRWYYYSHMTRDEALLLKCYDSARDGRTRYTAHSGFENPHAPPHTPPRESIELRTLLAFD